MRIKLIILSVALLAALPSAAGAAARSRTSHHYTATSQLSPMSTTGGYPALGGTAIMTGPVKASAVGNGVLFDHVKITGHPTDSVFTLAGEEVAFFPLGSVRDSFTGWAMLQPDGSLAVRVTGHATGGTGIYSGAKGTYVFNGSTPAGSTVIRGTSSGTFVY